MRCRRSGQLLERGAREQTRGRDVFKTAKPGGEQISLKENVERSMEGLNDPDNTMGFVRYRLLWWSSRSRGAWISSCCSEVILLTRHPRRLSCCTALIGCHKSQRVSRRFIYQQVVLFFLTCCSGKEPLRPWPSFSRFFQNGGD